MLVAGVLLSAGPRLASADEVRSDPALAHELFDEGRRLMAEKDYAGACAKFDESHRLDASGGGGTLLNLALCNEMLGHTGTAWALFRKARALAIRDRRADRQEFAETHIAQLSPRLVRLRITVPAPTRVAGVRIARNGVLLTESEWGEAHVVDPGEVIVEVSAPGRRPARLVVHLDEDGILREVVTPELPIVARGSVSAKDRREPLLTGTQPWAVALGGLGAATLFAGGMLAVRATRRQHAADTLCPNYDHCEPLGITTSAEAASDARVSVALFVTGAITVAGSVAWYLLGGKSRSAHGATDAAVVRF